MAPRRMTEVSPDSDPCSPEDLAATIMEAIGLDSETELRTPSGRPMQLFRDGNVITDLLT